MTLLAIPERESRVTLWARRALIAIVAIYAVVFCWSMTRRIWQVMSIEPRTSSRVLRPGTTVGFDVVTSGEVPNLLRLELVQGPRCQILLEQQSRVRSNATFDPRIFRHTPTVDVTVALLSRFEPGPARLRVTGFGRMKLLRTPAPRVTEVDVQLAPDRERSALGEPGNRHRFVAPSDIEPHISCPRPSS